MKLVEVLLYVHRNRRLNFSLGTGAQDGHLDFHTAPELWNVDDDVGVNVRRCPGCKTAEWWPAQRQPNPRSPPLIHCLGQNKGFGVPPV